MTDFSVTSLNDWSIKDYDTNFSQEKVDTKAYGIKFFDDEASAGGDADGIVAIALTSSDWTIIYGKDELTTDDELTIDYNANVAAQSERITATNIGLVQITLDWASNAPIISGVTSGQKINVVYGESFELPEATATSYDGGGF